jgi:hypothetical protein
MNEHFRAQYEALQHVIPDIPRDAPAYAVNPPLWRGWLAIQPSPEHPLFTEQEVVRRLDLLYMGDGTCHIG